MELETVIFRSPNVVKKQHVTHKMHSAITKYLLQNMLLRHLNKPTETPSVERNTKYSSYLIPICFNC